MIYKLYTLLYTNSIYKLIFGLTTGLNLYRLLYTIIYLLTLDLFFYVCYDLYRLDYTNMTEEQQNLAPKQQAGIIRVSISDAARLFGVNAQTIRRAVANKEVTYVVVAGRYKINFESLVKWSQQKTTVKRKTDSFGIGQYVDKWKIKNTLYSPSPKLVLPNDDEKKTP